MGADRGAPIAGRAGLASRPRAAAQAAALVVFAAILALSGCDGGGTASIVTPSATSAPAATPTPVLGEPKTIVEIAVTACRRKDGELLASLVSGSVSDAEIEALFARGSDVQLRSFTFPQEEGTVVSVAVGLLIQRDGGAEEVERMWELEQTGDVWRFTSLPDCF